MDRMERSSVFPPVQETNENQENPSSSTSSPVSSPVNKTPLEDELPIPDKGENKLLLVVSNLIV